MFAKESLVSFVMLFALTGCQEKKDYAYWMQHPAQLSEVMQRCHAKTSESLDEASQCTEAKRAASDFMTIVNEQQMNPEKFGRRVMQAEIELTQAKQKLQQLRKDQVVAEQIVIAAKAYQEKKEEVKTLLAVLSTQSPE